MDDISKEILEKPDPSMVEALYSDDQDSYDRKKCTRKRRVKHDKKKKITRKKRTRSDQKINQYHQNTHKYQLLNKLQIS